MKASQSKPVLFILCGLPFSGKSTLGQAIAAYTNSAVVRFDDIYDAHAHQLMKALDTLAVWQTIRDMAKVEIMQLLSQGVSVVYDNTSFHVAHRRVLKEAAAMCGAEAIVIYVNTPIEVIRERQRKNRLTQERGDISDTDFRYVAEQMEKPTRDEGVVEYQPQMDLKVWLAELVSVDGLR